MTAVRVVTETYQPQRGTYFDPTTADAIRRSAHRNLGLYDIHAALSSAALMDYPGPGAVCPDCREVIQPGQSVLRFTYDFAGYGRYTPTPVWMHAEPCRAERGITPE